MSETAQYYRSKHQALSFDFPILIFLGKQQDLFSNVHNALGVMFGYAVENIQGVDSDICFGVGKTNQCVV